MNGKEKILFFAKLGLIAGLLIMGTAIFMDAAKVARLSSINSDQEMIKYTLSNKYTVTQPERPVDQSQFVIAPDAPAANATDADKAAYEEKKKAYTDEQDKLKKEYDSAMEQYKTVYKQYQLEQQKMNYEKIKEKGGFDRKAQELKSKAELQKISINYMMTTALLRYLGSLIMLLGAFGILLYGDTYERLGVLVVIGFGLKTIIGL